MEASVSESEIVTYDNFQSTAHTLAYAEIINLKQLMPYVQKA
jgi:hypothetical protein